jgi:hypothetical protein
VIIIGLSGNHSLEKEAKEAGMDSFYIKPSPAERILETVSQMPTLF